MMNSDAATGFARQILFAAVLFFGLAANAPVAVAQELPDTLKGHGGPIKAIEISPDGKRVLTASFDYSLILWDLTAPAPHIVHRFEGHDGAVNDVAFVPGSNHAVSVSDDGSLGIWDLEAGTLVTRINAENYKVHGVAVSADGTKAAAARWDGTVKLYDLTARSEIATLSDHRGNVNSVVFSADGKKLYSAAYDGQILEWDAASGERIRSVYKHGWGINAITLINENRLIFGALNGTAGVVRIEEAALEATLAQKDRPILSVKVSRDGALMGYANGAGVIEIFLASSNTKVEASPVAFGPVWDFDFVPDTNQIYHVGLDDFATRWRIAPRDTRPIQSEFPRRFQLTESDDPGELEFRRKCSICHTLTPDDGNRAGPTLYGVFGRKAGAVKNYSYSPALKNSGIIWNEETIAQLFDHGPDIMVPGTKMPIQRLKSVERRDALIAFLKSATASLE